ncbi:MAG: glycosyltransferase family 2 protein [Acidobacteria bacterium]|nr:glycosyltransferase family 2 protein [Acidobacteriota bacterium]
MPITIVIIHWNARAHLERCVPAALATGCPVIVVDNASRDGAAEMVRVRWPEVQLLAADRNLGFAGGVNTGVAQADTQWVLILNPDILLTREAVARMRAAGGQDPRIGAVGAQLIDADGTPQHGFSIRRFPTLATWLVDLLLIDQLWPANPVSARYHAVDLDPSRDQDVEQPAAACLLLRREALTAIGGFDAAFHPAWFEDVDACRRLIDAGWRIRYVADARVVHEGGGAMRALGLGSFAAIWYRNLLRYARRHGTSATRAVLPPLMVTGMLLRAAVSLVRGRTGDAGAYLRVIPLVFRD